MSAPRVSPLKMRFSLTKTPPTLRQSGQRVGGACEMEQEKESDWQMGQKHKNISIENNSFSSCRTFAIRAQNWEDSSILNNTGADLGCGADRVVEGKQKKKIQEQRKLG